MPANAIHAVLKFAGLGIAGLALLSTAERLDGNERHATETALLFGMTGATALLWVGAIYGAETGEPLWGIPGQHPIAVLSHAQTVMAMFTVPALFILWRRRLKYFVLALGIAIGYAFLHLEHEASDLAVVAAAIALALPLVAGSRFAIPIGAAIALAVLAMPIAVDHLIPTTEALLAKQDPNGPWPSSLHREYMWRFALEKIAGDHFWLGHGMDASRGFPGANEKIMWGIELMPLHPHNGALQAWLELGPLGAVLAGVPALLAAWAARQTDKHGAALICAVLCAYAVPWLVSYGVWQSWWISLGWLAAAIGAAIMPAKTPAR